MKIISNVFEDSVPERFLLFPIRPAMMALVVNRNLRTRCFPRSKGSSGKSGVLLLSCSLQDTLSDNKTQRRFIWCLTVQHISQRKQVTLGATRKFDQFLSRYTPANNPEGGGYRWATETSINACDRFPREEEAIIAVIICCHRVNEMCARSRSRRAFSFFK